MPEAQIPKTVAKIYDLQNPTAKMSKSAETEAGLIKVLDPANVTKKKIMRAVTDDGTEIRFDRAEKPGVSNLLTILSVLGERSVASLETEFTGKGYGHLKRPLPKSSKRRLRPFAPAPRSSWRIQPSSTGCSPAVRNARTTSPTEHSIWSMSALA